MEIPPKRHTVILLLLLVGAVLVAFGSYWMETRQMKPRESFITLGGSVGSVDMMSMSTQALDSAPTTSEAKDYYKKLLIYADADIRKQGTKGLRILADLRDRLFDRPNFRDNLVVDDFLDNYPEWLPPIDTSIQAPPPEDSDAILAEVRILAFLQKNYPQEANLDEQTGSLIRGIVEDFGYRFVFKRDLETVQLKDDFMKVPLMRGWTNPIAAS
jgi:hypothetical protein